ncbi:hypothetical protein JB92DRAFT_1980172 [Gautieria morchelliformis]|nr:hypothetical protein JB92DRAFT_1980172 [Gautieria morchelliformis]
MRTANDSAMKERSKTCFTFISYSEPASVAMFPHLLDQARRYILKIRCILMGDPARHIYFSADKAVRVSVGEAVKNAALAHSDIAVVKVEHRKMTAPPFHEFLAFHVEHRSKAVILAQRYTDTRAERPERLDQVEDGLQEPELLSEDVSHVAASLRPQHSTPDLRTPDLNPGGQPHRKSISVTSFISSSSASISHLSRFIGGKPSYDCLTICNAPEKELLELDANHICRSFTVPKGEFSVGQLTVLANVVHEHHQNYDLLAYQCYWFAAVMYTVVLESCRKKCPKLKENVHRLNKTGRFGGVQVRLGNRNTTSKVTKKFETEWGKTQKIVIIQRKETNAAEQLAQRAREAEERADAEAERADAEAERANHAEQRLPASIAGSP